MKSKTQTLWLVLGILFIAAFLRFYALDQYPPGLYPDEAVNATDAIRALEDGSLKLYYPNNNGREGLFINLLAISQSILGINIYAIRIVPALIGLITIFFIYLLGKETFGRNAGLVSSFLVAVSYWHLNFSRIDFRAILVPLILSASFYFLFRGYNKLLAKKSCFTQFQFLIAGLIFGVGFHTYIAFRIAPVIIIAFFGLIFLTQLKFKGFPLKKLFLSGAVFLLGCVLTTLPMIYNFAKNPQYLSARQNDNSISVMDPRNNQGNLPLAVLKTTGVTLGQFFYRGDSNWRHNLPSIPLLSPFVSLMFLIGIAYVTGGFVKNSIVFCSGWKKKKNLGNKPAYFQREFVVYGTLLVWFFFMLAPAFLTVEGLPHALRSIGSIPAVFLIASIPFVMLLEKKIRFIKFPAKDKVRFLKILRATAFCALAMTLFYNTLGYFYIWGKSSQASEAFEKRLVEIGKYLKDGDNKTVKYLIVNQDSKETSTGYPVSLETVRFFNYPQSDQTVYLKQGAWTEINPELNYEIILQKEDRKLIETIEKRYPVKAEVINPDLKRKGEEFIVLR